LVDPLDLILAVVGVIAGIIFGYFEIVIPFVRGEVKLSKRWPFVENVKMPSSYPEYGRETRGKGVREPAGTTGSEGADRALLFTDLVGFISLKLRDEKVAGELLDEFRGRLVEISAKHDGRVIRSIDDEFLLSFTTAMEATLCAIELQRSMKERNESTPEERRFEIRAGVHIGEVDVRGMDVSGEGVRIVTRIERLAEPGGVCVTENIFRRIRTKIDTPIRRLGRSARKEIDDAISVYRIALPWEKAPRTLAERLTLGIPSRGRRTLTTVSGLVLLAILFFFGYLFITPEVESEEPIPLAVVDFANQTGEPELDGLSGMLITSLEQSRRLSVLTRARMFDILRRLGRENIERIDETLGREICKQADLDALVIASIRKFGENYHIDLKVLDPGSDTYIFTAREEGKGQESIPGMMDRLSERTRVSLKEKRDEILLTSRKVAEVTTPNLEAYQHYFQGEEYINHLQFREAREEFRKAVTLDSTFALAHYRLAYAYGWEDESMAREPLAKALKLIDQIPDKEQYLVRAEDARLNSGFEAGVRVLKEMEEIYPDAKEMIYNIGDWSFHEGELQTAANYLERVLEMDPLHERALQHLTWTYASIGENERMRETVDRYTEINEIEGTVLLGLYYYAIGDYSRAEETFQRALSMRPKHPEALMRLAILYGHIGRNERFLDYALRYEEEATSKVADQILGFAYIVNGEYKKGLKKIEKAREISPNNPDLTVSIAFFYTMQGLYAEATAELETLVAEGKPREVRVHGYNGFLFYHVFRGQYREAIRDLDMLMELRQEAEDIDQLGRVYMTRGFLKIFGWNDVDGARRDLESALEYQEKIKTPFFWFDAANLRLLLGDTAEAERIVQKRLSDYMLVEPFSRFAVQFLKGECGSLDSEGLALLEASPPDVRVYVYNALASCRLSEGRLDEAIAAVGELQGVLGGDLLIAVYHPRSYALLGKIYEEKGDRERARENYERFLELWNEADEDLPERIDVRLRFERLEDMVFVR
jgi:tetratricopeptide (TPR) repeat protein/class 3 adenylate cyclase